MCRCRYMKIKSLLKNVFQPILLSFKKRTWYFTFSLQMDFYCQPAHKTNGKRLYSQCETKRRRTLKNNFILEQNYVFFRKVWYCMYIMHNIHSQLEQIFLLTRFSLMILLHVFLPNWMIFFHLSSTWFTDNKKLQFLLIS